MLRPEPGLPKNFKPERNSACQRRFESRRKPESRGKSLKITSGKREPNPLRRNSKSFRRR